MRLASALVVLACAAGCKDEPVAVTPAGGGGDHGRTQLIGAVTQLTSGGHTPAAFVAFRDRLFALRPTMDETVAEEAELFAVTQAVEVARKVPGAARGAEELVLSVWPLALAPPLTAPVPGAREIDAWSRWMPAAGEDARAYLGRLCGGLLALQCKNIVPEGHAIVVGELAIEQLTERARRSVARCLTCADPSWANKVAAWETLDREATSLGGAAEQTYAPSRWPVAGEGSRESSDAPLLYVAETGSMELDGRTFSPDDEAQAIELLRTARGGGTTLRVHLPPKLTAERVRRAQGVAAAAGYTDVAVVARRSEYPYEAREYAIAVKQKLPVKDGDPVQIMLRVLDTAARKGTAKLKL